MPLFAIICIDNPGGAELRDKTREAHVAYVRSQPVSVKLAGPRLDEAGAPSGSILVVEADDLAAAQSFIAGDPYKGAGVFAQCEIHPWRLLVGRIG